MTDPQTQLDEALAADIANFLNKSWKLLQGSMDNRQQAWAASEGQKQINKFVEGWIKNFMTRMGTIYKRDATDPESRKLTPQNLVWSKLEWIRLYNFLKLISVGGDESTQIKSDKEIKEMLINPLFVRVLKAINYDKKTITIQDMKSRVAISTTPYNKLKQRYASQDIALALITLACERAAAKHYGIDDDVDPDAEFIENIRKNLETWGDQFSDDQHNAEKIKLITDILGFLKQNHEKIDDAANPSEVKKMFTSADVINDVLKMNLADPHTPAEEQKLNQSKQAIKQILVLQEQQYRHITQLFESVGLTWSDIGWRADLAESHNGIIIMRHVGRYR